VAWSARLKVCPLLSPTCSPQHQCLHWSWTQPNQTAAPLLSGLNPFCHSHLSDNLTVNGLWYAYLIVRLSAYVCRMGSCFIFQDCVAWPKFVALGYIASCPLLCRSLLGFRLNHHMKRRTCIATFGAVLVAPVMTRQSDLCNLSSILLILYVNPGH